MTGPTLEGRWGDSAAALAGFDNNAFLQIVTEGPDLVVRALNAKTREFLGGRPVLGRTLREGFGDLMGQQLLERYDEVFRTGESFQAHEWRIEMELGGVLTPIYTDHTLTAWRGEDGSIRGVVSQVVDVTQAVLERQRREAEGADLHERFLTATELVTTLQDALLPPDVPVLPQLDIAARYLLAEADTAAGGDWFDAVPRPDGTLALVVGDVVGHGVAASSVMGQLRSILVDRLDDGAPTDETLAVLDRFASRVEGARAATVCLVVLDPRTGELEYCTAGHPPPLVVSSRGETRFLAPSGAGPLWTGGAFPTARARLEVGELVLVYSDGLVERPGRSVAQNTVDLAQVAADTALGRARIAERSSRAVERVCAGSIELLTRITGYADDITLLAAQRVPATAPLSMHLPAEAASVAVLRRDLGQWLDALGVGSLDEMALQHGVGEAVVNVVEHAYLDTDPAPGITVEAHLGDDGQLEATVSDRGRWREKPPGAVGGQGLAIATGLADALHVQRGDDGTTVTMRRRAGRPATMLTGSTVGLMPAPKPEEYAERLAEDRLTVSGPLDVLSAARLRVALQRLLRGGTSSVVVDLTDVTILGSAAVQALHEAHAMSDGDLRLYAPVGSAAQHVLELVRLSYAADTVVP